MTYLKQLLVDTVTFLRNSEEDIIQLCLFVLFVWGVVEIMKRIPPQILWICLAAFCVVAVVIAILAPTSGPGIS